MSPAVPHCWMLALSRAVRIRQLPVDGVHVAICASPSPSKSAGTATSPGAPHCSENFDVLVGGRCRYDGPMIR